MSGERWSDVLLPAVGGVRSGSDNHDDVALSEKHGEDGPEGESGDDDDGFDGSVLSLRSHSRFSSVPSYMKAKSGVEMDPDRVRFFYLSCGAQTERRRLYGLNSPCHYNTHTLYSTVVARHSGCILVVSACICFVLKALTGANKCFRALMLLHVQQKLPTSLCARRMDNRACLHSFPIPRGICFFCHLGAHRLVIGSTQAQAWYFTGTTAPPLRKSSPTAVCRSS